MPFLARFTNRPKQDIERGWSGMGIEGSLRGKTPHEVRVKFMRHLMDSYEVERAYVNWSLGERGDYPEEDEDPYENVKFVEDWFNRHDQEVGQYHDGSWTIIDHEGLAGWKISDSPNTPENRDKAMRDAARDYDQLWREFQNGEEGHTTVGNVELVGEVQRPIRFSHKAPPLYLFWAERVEQESFARDWVG